eukprot:TRINITY_DN56419_c0_g1_i2.p1 TRINITY_DN56419_c0_g1~~TRINITY_DN56419_c0_g1_i2.p1  ORF type:complete len:269 (+),score=10.54 TRINITY_DN56419_c0_g1_i2:137-943(+)
MCIRDRFMISVRGDSTICASGVIAMSALAQRLASEAGVSGQLREYGVTTIGEVEEVWQPGMNSSPMSGSCFVCGMGLLSSTQIAQIPCCKRFAHDVCLLTILKSGSNCTSCKVHNPRLIPEDAKRFIATFSSSKLDEQSNVVQQFAAYDKTTIGTLFGFIRPDSESSPTPFASMTVEELMNYIVDHPAPSRITKDAGTIVSVFLAPPIVFHITYLLSVVMCHTGVEDPLLPGALGNLSKVNGLTSTIPTTLGKWIVKIGALLHFHSGA